MDGLRLLSRGAPIVRNKLDPDVHCWALDSQLLRVSTRWKSLRQLYTFNVAVALGYFFPCHLRAALSA
ncbi:hypothetical protein BN77_p10143 [Rhizobium mesoamericanum STM3625]|uniref:Uncharacterized protein n=1 Tax=Rhizobium mesoamericanum STM3625 TaxID=1211777 RepID=K0PWR5_9HYPH|nr:hypothetical protein BN77_p10143 [Rhizobium mesoamericanum STM3625]